MCSSDLLDKISGQRAVESGGHVQLHVSEERVNELLALCATGRAHLLALNPQRISLEEYFVEVLEKTAAR